MFTTTDQVKDLNGLQFKFSFLYNRYEKITKLTRQEIRIVEENSLRLIVTSIRSYYSHFLSSNTIIVTLHLKKIFHHFSAFKLVTVSSFIINIRHF